MKYDAKESEYSFSKIKNVSLKPQNLIRMEETPHKGNKTDS